MLDEITLTRVQFDTAVEEVLDHIKEAADRNHDPMMLLRMGSLAAIICADLETTLFKEVKLEVQEEPTNGDKNV